MRACNINIYTYLCICVHTCVFFCLSLKGEKKNDNNSNNRRTVALPTFESRNLFKDNGQINMYVCMRLGEQTAQVALAPVYRQGRDL